MDMRFAFLVAAVMPVAVQAQQTIRDSTISVSATKVTRIAPDRASMYVLVEGSAETPTDAVTRVETPSSRQSPTRSAASGSVRK